MVAISVVPESSVAVRNVQPKWWGTARVRENSEQ